MFIASRYGRAACLAVFLIVLFAALSLTEGSVRLSLHQVASALQPTAQDVSPMIRGIVLDIRLPRTLLALMTGAGLAVVGALLQTATRNELADPFLFGLSSGASAGAVLVFTRFGDFFGAWTLPVAAFCGGLLSSVAVLSLFQLKRERGAETLIICGLAISFLFGALTSYLIFAGDQRTASSVLFWSLGGLGLARWDNLGFALAGLLLLAAFCLLRWRSLDGLLAGDRTAFSLGINVNRLRTEIFLCCAFSTAIFVALTGVIGFVGLMVPHLCRHFSAIRHARLLPLCALAGASLLCGGDIVSRVLVAPQELPIGIITAGIGGLFIVVMVARR